MEHLKLEQIRLLYGNVISAWNIRNAEGLAEQFAKEGVMIGFDGSLSLSQEEILSHLKPIFENHPTPPFVSKIKDIRLPSADTAILRAIVGMIPPGKTEMAPELNAHQTLIAIKKEGLWKIELFQNTPAQFHGRPELVEEMTNELRESLL